MLWSVIKNILVIAATAAMAGPMGFQPSAPGSTAAEWNPQSATQEKVAEEGHASPSTIGDQDQSQSVSMPDNPNQPLPEKISNAIPKDATVVANDLALTPDQQLKQLDSGKKVTDPKIVGTSTRQADPLAKTNGESFIPVHVDKVRKAIKDSKTDSDQQTKGNQGAAVKQAIANLSQSKDGVPDSSVRSRTSFASLQNNEYGAHWGFYQGSQAFFEADGTLFAEQAKGVIDVSVWQNTINWEAVKNSGVDGAIIRLGYGWGNGLDKQAKRNISECKRLGIPFGVYIYSYAYDANTAAAEGDNAVNLLRQAGVSPYDLSYPVHYDLENWTWAGHSHPTDPGTYDQIVNTWWGKLSSAGYNRLSLYSYTNYLYSALNSDNIHSKTHWVASYGPRTGFHFRSADKGWQYSSSGSVSGISGHVDLNAFSNTRSQPDFNGTDPNSFASKVTDVPEGRYYIASLFDNRYVDVTGASPDNGVPLDIWPYNGQDNQKFYIKPAGGGNYTIATSYGKVVDASGPSADNGTPLIQFSANGGRNQQWTLYRCIDGSYYIASVYAGSRNKVWDITASNGAPGSRLELWAANQGENQRFKLVSVNGSGNGNPSASGQLVSADGGKYWYENGEKARSKEIYDSSAGLWYWAGDDGQLAQGWKTLPDGRRVYYDPRTLGMAHGERLIDGAWYYFAYDGNMVRSRDLYLTSNGGKYVRYAADGKMVKGESSKAGKWYFFDPVTGAMAKGWKHVSSNGGKWVYYDPSNGQMLHGEAYINENWYYFNDWSGATTYGWKHLASNGGKWVYYDPVMGWMLKGWHQVDGSMRHFDETTGAVLN